MRRFDVTGMSCAACAARVEKAVNALPDVDTVSVNLLMNSMQVEGSASDADIVNAVTAAGYGASPKTEETAGGQSASVSGTAKPKEDASDAEFRKIRKRLVASICFLLPLMYVSMGVGMWNWPAHEAFRNNPLAIGLYEMLLAIIVMVINRQFFISGVNGLMHKAPNMDTLVAMGSAASFGYSTYILFKMCFVVISEGHMGLHSLMHEFYFESAAMILTLITVGKMLEAYAKGRTTDAIKGLQALAPETANVIRDGVEINLSIDQVRVGDVVAVRPGEAIPVDGIILEGSSAVNEAALTGESVPVDKAEGDTVSAATINQSGFLLVETRKTGSETALAGIIRLVSDAAGSKAPIAKLADKVAGIFVPAVITVAVITIIIWLIARHDVGFALARGISVLAISCPCALGLATPVAIMVGSGVGAKHGILFKSAAALEETGRITTVVMDKTGTLTKGEPSVTGIYPAAGVTKEELLRKAFILESPSEHPLAGAVKRLGEAAGLTAETITDFEALPGNGLSGKYKGRTLTGGSLSYISKQTDVEAAVLEAADAEAGKGGTPLLFTEDGRLLGMISVADTLKEDGAEAVAELREMGIKVVLLTGDNAKTAAAVAKAAGVDEVIAGVLPDGKEEVIRKLKESGKVAMVGDGINDAPALVRADVGIAIGTGTDIAADAADIMLMQSRVRDVPAAIRLGRGTLRNIRQNLFWAFFYNACGIPLAAGVFIGIWGWQMNPMFGAAAMSLSSVFVVTNALRLNLIKIYGKGNRIPAAMPEKVSGTVDKANDNSYNEEQILQALGIDAAACAEERSCEMEKTIKVEGMMCHNCENHVKKALEKLEGVVSATADFEKGTAVVVMDKDVEDALLKAAIEEEGYKVVA